MEFLNTNPTAGSTDPKIALLNLFIGDLKASKENFGARSRPELARFKMKIFWLQKNKAPLVKYSEDFEWISGKQIHSEKSGYMELREIIVAEHKKDSFLSAMVWASVDQICETAKTKYNLEVIKKVRGKSGEFYPGLRWNDDGSAIILLKPTE